METQKLLAWFKNYPTEGYVWPQVTDLWFAAVTCVLLLVVEKLIVELFYPFYY
jgi:hypothetical protein